MRSWKTPIVVTLVGCVCFLSVSDTALWAKAAAAAPTAQTKESVRLLGEGAKVKVKLVDGAKLKSVIEAVNGDAFLLMMTKERSKTVAFDQIAELKSAKRSYKAKGPIDALEARRAVMGLGVGQHIMAKFDGDQELHGHIKTIGVDHFAILPD